MKKIYVVTYANASSGGNESLHQLCSKLNNLNLDAYIYYLNNPKAAIPYKFKRYNIKSTHNIDDSEENILIVPEISTSFLYKFNKIKKCIWWLSLDFYLRTLPKFTFKNFVNDHNIPRLLYPLAYLYLKCTGELNKQCFEFREDKNHIFHFYNCEYAKQYLINQRDIFQHVPITSRKPVKPDSKGVPGFFAFWGSSRILANPGAS